MHKDTPSYQTSTVTRQMGLDGWFTLLLSTSLIGLSVGLTLLWQWRTVVRHARNSSTTLNDDVELVLIPCMKLVGGKPGKDFRQRLQRAHELHQRYGVKLLLMGGHTNGSSVSEAQAGTKYLVTQGIGLENMVQEDRSRNTLENLRNAREQIGHLKTKNIALISNRYHLARCLTLANGLQMTPQLCAAESSLTLHPRIWPRLLMEAYYLHWYHTGKIWSRLTRNQHSLTRIS
jgi:vancomycin permeability regulator SanA